jgi:hypothetical protein
MAERTNIANLAGLNELAARDGIDIKPTLLRVTTDLYVQKSRHTPEEERHYIELAIRLIEQVDAATRAIVAGRLAGYAGAPRAVVERLAQIRRQHGEADAAVDATAPPAAAAEPPLARQPNLRELTELFMAADAEERRLILTHLEYSGLPPAEPLAPAAAREAARRLEEAALGHNSEAFVQEIERSLLIGRNLARRLADDASGEPVLVIALALQMPADVLQRILLCLNPAISHSVLRVYELSRLYEEIEPQSARQLLALWQSAERPGRRRSHQPAAHRPQLHDDNKATAPVPARPAIRWDEHALRREGER